MKTPEEIRKKLDEFREDLFKKDIIFRDAIATGNIGESTTIFEAMVTLEGGIEAFKWALEESALLDKKTKV